MDYLDFLNSVLLKVFNFLNVHYIPNTTVSLWDLLFDVTISILFILALSHAPNIMKGDRSNE